MKREIISFSGLVVCALALARCAHAPIHQGTGAETLFADACSPGQANRSVTGSIWMKATSKEAKGQFPASVNAHSPDSVTLEVTNLIGSRQALIRVNHGSYTIDVPEDQGRRQRQEKGEGSWGGIPLRWASELFLGRIPCPSSDSGSFLQMRANQETGELIVETPVAPNGQQERFIYKFHQWAGKPWPESLHWERKGLASTFVDFKFDDPDDKTGSPKKWEAKSPLGEVKLRWTDFKASPNS